MKSKTYKLTILISIIIIILSTIPVPEVKPLEAVPFFDKWVHFVMYGSLTCAMYLDRKLQGQDKNIVFIVLAIIYPSLLGGLMELVQAYLTTCRSGDWLDFYADAFGTVLATILSLALWKIVKISARK